MKKKIAEYKNVSFTYSFVMGILPDSMLAQNSIFPQAKYNELYTFTLNNYQLALVFKCVEGGFEAGPQLVIRCVRREKCDAASELAANTFVIFAGKRRLIAAKLHSFVTQM